MVRCGSLCAQLIALFNRRKFYELVHEDGAVRYPKGYASWKDFTAMLSSQVAQAKNHREISGGLACCIGKLRHLGMKNDPNRLTRSYVNAHRPWDMYRELFYETLDFSRKSALDKHKFSFENKLPLSKDSATLPLCLSLFPWAKFRRNKGAIKLTFLLDHNGYLARFAYITNGERHDVNIVLKVPLSPGSSVVMDFGHNDYRQLAYLNHLDFGATTISAIYKDRWQIELFFKTAKQNPKVNFFVGTTEDALYIQIWTALIAILVIKYPLFKSKFQWSVSNLVTFLRWNLYTNRNLWKRVVNPLDLLPLQPGPVQSVLPLAGLGQHIRIKKSYI